MPTETERRVDLVLAVIRDLKADGVLPRDAAIKPQGMAYVSEVIGLPVSTATFRRLESRAVERARLARLALDAYQTNRAHS